MADKLLTVTLDDIKEAQKVLAGVVRHTELDHSFSVSKLLDSDIYFKMENTQYTGSFKLRGAYNKIYHLTPEEKKIGVVASSAGNHAQGVALSATKAGARSTIVMPETAPIIKIEATRAYGAEVILKGEIYDEAYEYARKLEKENNLVFVHPYQDEKVIAGQGTIGLEILSQASDIDTIVVPIGGGGMISGIATAVKSINPKCRVIGVQSEQTPGMMEMFKSQKPSQARRRITTIADGIAVKHPSQVMYDSFIKSLVDEVVTVSDDEIAESIVYLLERVKAVVEGAGAVGLAAAMSGKFKLGKKTCFVLGGGNIDLNIVEKIIEKGQIRRGRLAEVSVVVDDVPGTLHRLTKVIAEQKANIFEVHHDRISSGLYLRETRIDFVLETTSIEHIEKIKKALLEAVIPFGGKIL